MKKKEDKQKDLEALRKDLAELAEPVRHRLRKAAVSQDFELRKVVRGAGGNYKVVKNNMAEKASRRDSPAEPVLKGLRGMTLAGLHHRAIRWRWPRR